MKKKPPDCILRPKLLHSDHFDQKVEQSLRRDLPIITTPHAKTHLADAKSKDEAFTAVHDLDFFQDIIVDIVTSDEEGGSKKKKPAIKVTGMPGKHVPPGVLGTLNDLVEAVGVFGFFFGFCSLILSTVLLCCDRGSKRTEKVTWKILKTP